MSNFIIGLCFGIIGCLIVLSLVIYILTKNLDLTSEDIDDFYERKYK